MISKYYKGMAPIGPIYQNVDKDKYNGPSLPDFEPFHETVNNNFATKHNGNSLTLLIISFSLQIKFF